ncbi:MAG TPA: hypothetical protein VF401_00825 [Candidatus Saccharimonadales bacterium]
MKEIDDVIHAFEADESKMGDTVANAYLNMIDYATQPQPLSKFQLKWIDRHMYPALGGEDGLQFAYGVMNHAGLTEAFDGAYDQAYVLLNEKMDEAEQRTSLAS